MKTRRNIIKTGLKLTAASGVLLTGISIPGVIRGFRYPILQYEPRWTAQHLNVDDLALHVNELTLVRCEAGLRLRASGLRPSLLIHSTKQSEIDVEIENVSPTARIEVDGASIEETGEGLRRRVRGTISSNQSVKISWRLPRETDIRFAAIGDTGGNKELEWCLTRATRLGAAFMLHLGDYFYGGRDIETTPMFLNNASIPTFSTIGNHDFHAGFDLVHRDFTDRIGPRNSTFKVAHLRFVNVDTAAATLPVSRGERGYFLNQVANERLHNSDETVVVFTHAPLTDPRASADNDHDHTVTDREKPWLRRAYGEIGASMLLCGHVHESAEVDEQGIRCYVAGEGLAYADYGAGKQVARILVADIEPDNRHTVSWQPLLMPADFHCSFRLRKLGVINSPDFGCGDS